MNFCVCTYVHTQNVCMYICTYIRLHVQIQGHACIHMYVRTVHTCVDVRTYMRADVWLVLFFSMKCILSLHALLHAKLIKDLKIVCRGPSDSGLSQIRTQYNKPLYKGQDLRSYTTYIFPIHT